ncbi:uracil-DNA glycosylase [Sulfuriferula thiophila]|uniref:uracil-DNA glycosylase n=1 Tax=Sulfuriferula thiophila TaxID=1781211 RepID=UPI000F613AF2|nr:uracil-DNA glycosylase [Sulfuriferula thiophila]
MSTLFDAGCVECPRLAGFLQQVRTDYPTYYARPVPPFGDAQPWLLIVGLAPGLHGANRSGRPFTGDHAGILLYQTLHQFGFASQAESVSADDALVLHGCRITNAVKCLPPANKPETGEVRQCNHYLAAEIAALPAGAAILALGSVAHAAVLMALGLPAKTAKFGHGAVHELANGSKLYDSYHCSRYNTQTRRLTTDMFHAVFAQIVADKN